MRIYTVCVRGGGGGYEGEGAIGKGGFMKYQG